MFNREMAVTTLYKKILGRSPDASGLDHYIKMMESVRGNPFDIVGGCLYRSQEFASKNGKKIWLDDHGGISLSSNPAHIIPIGTHCLSALIMRDYGIRKHTLPFDWLFSSPSSIAHCIKDDFKTLLDASMYSDIKRSSTEPGCQHKYYLDNFGIDSMFPHADPRDETTYRRLVKSIHRMKSIFNSDDKKVFVMICRDKFDLEHYIESVIDSISKSTKNFHFAAISISGLIKKSGPSMDLVSHGKHYSLHRMTPESDESNTAIFTSARDDLSILSVVLESSVRICTNVEYQDTAMIPAV